MARVTASPEGSGIWPEKPVQLNRKTVASIALLVIAALGLGLQLGLRQMAAKTEPPEDVQSRNLYVQAETPDSHRRDFTYKELTREATPTKPELEPTPSAVRSSRPDPLTEQRRREEEEAQQSGLFPQGAQDLARSSHTASFAKH